MMPLVSPWSAHSQILRLVGPGHGRRLLDVGAGPGLLASRLARHGWKVMAIDKHPLVWHGRYPFESVVVDLDQWVPEWLMGLGRFDTIVCADVLEHLVHPDKTIGVLRCMLLVEGRIIISLPNIAHWSRRFGLLGGDWTTTERGLLDRTHVHFYTRRTAGELVRRAGLRILHQTATPAPVELRWPRCPKILGRLQAMLARLWPTLFGYQSIFVCERERTHHA